MTERICSFDGCNNAHNSHGYCSSHNHQIKMGKPLTPLRPSNLGKSLRERFFEKVDKTEGCWLWTGSKSSHGYGQIYVSDEKRVVMAHRASLRLVGRECPPGLEVDHLCRVRCCVNPDHLEPVTHAVNIERAPSSAQVFQSAKTHCPHGHEYTPENIKWKVNASGTLSRECKTCRAEGQRRYRAKKRARQGA